MKANILREISRLGMGPGVKQRGPASKAIRSSARTSDMGAMVEAQDHLDMILEEAGIPLFVLDEMSGKMKRSPAAEKLLELMELLSGRNRRR
tara:strand:+ start:9106 stop:9381 length:276 start_codon:yes stop_codon:yes gene_type:complete